MTGAARTVTVLSHTRPAQTGPALRALMAAAEREGVRLRFDADETRKYELVPRDGLDLDAPHSLTARALVVAPGDLLSVHNRSQDEVEISLDGRPGGTLDPGEAIAASFLREAADLAQVPGSSFYRRMRQKFGRLAS